MDQAAATVPEDRQDHQENKEAVVLQDPSVPLESQEFEVMMV